MTKIDDPENFQNFPKFKFSNFFRGFGFFRNLTKFSKSKKVGSGKIFKIFDPPQFLMLNIINFRIQPVDPVASLEFMSVGQKSRFWGVQGGSGGGTPPLTQIDQGGTPPGLKAKQGNSPAKRGVPPLREKIPPRRTRKPLSKIPPPQGGKGVPPYGGGGGPPTGGGGAPLGGAGGANPQRGGGVPPSGVWGDPTPTGWVHICTQKIISLNHILSNIQFES